MADDRAAKAAQQYADVDNGGTDLKSLIQAVRSAQAAKANLKKVGKKANKQAAEKAKAAAILAKKALDEEARVTAAKQKEDDDAARKALVRAQREKAVAEGRKALNSNLEKVRALKATVDELLKAGFVGSVSPRLLQDLKSAQASFKSAWSSLPKKYQYQEDQALISQNDELIATLERKAKTEQEEKSARDRFVQSYGKGYDAGILAGNAIRGARGLGSKSMNLAASLVGSGFNRAGSALSSLKNSAVSMGSGVGSAAMVQARRLVTATQNVASRLGDLAGDSKKWFADKFQGMFSRLFRLIRSPMDLVHKGKSLLTKGLNWGMLFVSVLRPIIEGLYGWMKDSVTGAFTKVGEWFTEAKTWIVSKITGWWESFFGWIKGGDKPKTSTEKAADLVSSKGNVGALSNLLFNWEGTNVKADKTVYANQINKILADANASGTPIPASVSAQLASAGFSVPSVAKATPSQPSVQQSSSGGSSSAPVTATPPAASTTSEGGTGMTPGTSVPGGPGVSQIPNNVLDDGLNAYNLGMLAG